MVPKKCYSGTRRVILSGIFPDTSSSRHGIQVLVWHWWGCEAQQAQPGLWDAECSERTHLDALSQALRERETCISHRFRIVARFGGQVRLSAVQVGKALQEMGFQSYRSHHGKFWKIFERPASDIGNIVPEDIDLPKSAMPFWEKKRVRC